MKQSAEQELVELIHAISHDLRAPVRHLKEFSHILFNENPPSLTNEQTQFKLYIEDSIAALDKKLERLLIYSRLNTQAPNISSCTVNSIFSHAIETFTEKNQKLVHVKHLNEESATSFSINTCQNSISLALAELLKNALTFSKFKNITITSEETKNGIDISVIDSGIGIQSAKLREDAFKLFSRLNHRAEYPGEGMGLNIARKAIERVGGTIHLQQNASQGITATLSIPNLADTSNKKQKKPT